MSRSPVLAAVLAAGMLPAQRDAVLSDADRAALAELQPEIDVAIDEGVAWLLSRQQRDGSWPAHEVEFPTGQTALSCYTLLKAGLSRRHGAVRRAAAFLAARPPTKVYAAGCQLLAFAALGAPEMRPRMKAVLADLLALQERGGWGYPNPQGSRPLHTDTDLSISQFAVLGLRAAERAGFDIPRAAWLEALESVLDYQTRPVTVGAGGDRRDIAGFTYRRLRGKPSGSMTCAGLAVLSLASAALGDRRPAALARDAARATALGRAWMDHRFSAEKNPGARGGWLHYYLYGVERAGALLGTEYFGTHPWYLEGARELIASQHAGGHWYSRSSESDTCFAILFLKRATAPTTGSESRVPKMHVAEDADAPVWLRVAESPDGSSLEMWLTRVRAPDGSAPRVTRVDYLVDDVIVGNAEGHRRAWQGDAYHLTHTFDRRGTYRVRAVVHTDGPAYESEPVEVRLENVLEPWMLDATRAGQANVLREIAIEARASSQDGRNAPARAADGRQATVWTCAEDDVSPWLELRARRAVRATGIVLSPAARRPRDRGVFDHITRVRLVLNGRTDDAIDVPMRPDALEPTAVELPRATSIRGLRIEILERRPGRRRGRAGFAEIALRR